MTDNNSIEIIYSELETGIQLSKCQKCGCMRETLDNLATLLPTVDRDEWQPLAQNIEVWAKPKQPIRYACLGCEHCYPAVAQNAFATAFPSISESSALSCDFQVSDEGWPLVVGEYFVLDVTAPVAVSTLASTKLAEDLASRKPQGLAIVGKTETENIGIDKIVKNIITNPAIQYLVVAGEDPKGHQPGRTLLALIENGVSSKGRVIGAPGKRPILRNVSVEEIKAFWEQVQVIDMIGCDSPDKIGLQIDELSRKAAVSCGCGECAEKSPPISISTEPTVVATEPGEVVTMDKAGYFVIVPLIDKGVINVEHYAYDNSLLRIIEGENARALYKTIIANGWVTELSHAAYLGKELTRAELSLTSGLKYVQDGA